MTRQNLTNNETTAAGIITEANGSFTALTPSASKNFKSRKGAEKFLALRGFSPKGERL